MHPDDSLEESSHDTPDSPERRDFLKVIGSGALGAFIASLRPSFLHAASGRGAVRAPDSIHSLTLQQIPKGMAEKEPPIIVPVAKKLLVHFSLPAAERRQRTPQDAVLEQGMRSLIEQLKTKEVSIDTVLPISLPAIAEARAVYRVQGEGNRNYLETEFASRLTRPLFRILATTDLTVRPCTENFDDRAIGTHVRNDAENFLDMFVHDDRRIAFVVATSTTQWLPAIKGRNETGASLNAVFLGPEKRQ